MDVSVAVEDNDAAESLRSLFRWLRQEPELRGQVQVVSRSPRSGEMGAVPDLLTVAMGAGGTVTVLAAALKAWFAQPRRSDVKITVRSPDGRAVELDARRVTDGEALLRAVLEAAPAPGSSAPRDRQQGCGPTVTPDSSAS